VPEGIRRSLNVPHPNARWSGARHRAGRVRTVGAYGGAIASPLPYPDPPLSCPAFRLRPFRTDDFADAAAFSEDPTTTRWVPPLPADDAEATVAAFERFRQEGDLLHLVIADAQDDGYLGEVMLVMGDHEVGEVGCGVVPSRRGSGIATGALRMFDRWCIDSLGIRRLQALVAAENAPGLELARRAGFRREGLLREYWGDRDVRLDVVMHSLLAHELPVGADAADGPGTAD
jgi:RimJ/RimL family protein N-acetyltransferase